MGANGQVVVEAYWSGSPGSANSKTGRIKFGGTTFRAVLITADVSMQGRARITNRNSVSSQVCFPAGGEYTTSSSAATTGAVNTAADVTILITGQLALGTETVTLESYSVRVEPRA